MDFAQNRFLGNIGAPLDPNRWDMESDLDDEIEDEGALKPDAINHAGSVGIRDATATLIPVVGEFPCWPRIDLTRYIVLDLRKRTQ